MLAEIGRTQRLEILNSLKRSKGMSVNELVRKMKMSYMGIKQHCLTLQRDGYLDTWRRPQKMGRPEMVYRLTRRTHDLFQTDSNAIHSGTAQVGPGDVRTNAAEKLLYNVFERKTAALKAKVKGETVADRAKWLARMRDNEGYMSQFSRREGRWPANSGMPFAAAESTRPIPDHRTTGTGPVRSGPRDKCPPGRDAQLGLLRVRILFRNLSGGIVDFTREIFRFRLGEFRLIQGPCSRAFPTAVIENLQPLINGGRYPIKRVVGEDLVVEADIFKDGHDVVAAVLEVASSR